MWTIIALAICLTWAVILKAQGHAWSTVIMRPLIGLGALMLATVFTLSRSLLSVSRCFAR